MMTDSEDTKGDVGGIGADASAETEPLKRFPEISSRAFEHPSDRAALTAMRKVPGFDVFVRKFVGLMRERSLRYLFLASAVRVSERQFSKVNRLYEECVEILDMPEKPELFVSQTPLVNAGAVGADHPFVVLNSGTIELLSDDELRQVLGHELGHILSGHVLFKTMLALMIQFSVQQFGIPLIGLARSAIIAALSEWDRKSELSSDRAGLLCVQDPTTTYTSFMKMAGGRQLDQMAVEEFMLQAEDYEKSGDKLDSVFKLFNLFAVRHPFWVLRLAELKRWVDRGDYEAILAGDYTKRDADDDASVVSEFTESAKSYKETATETMDPLFDSMRTIGAQIAETSGSIWSSLRSRFNKEDEPTTEDEGGTTESTEDAED